MDANEASRGIERTVVVLSTGRTGTMALAKYLDGCSDVTACHEPKPSRLLRIASGKSVTGGLSPDHLRQQLHRARRDLLSKVLTPIYVESNWYLYGFLDVLRDVFPGVRIVHVVRDPRTLIPSYLNFGTFRFPKSLLVNFVPYWYVRPEQRDPAVQRRWAKMDFTERLAFHWNTVNAELDRGAALYADDYLRLRYEDVFAATGTGLRQLLNFAGAEGVPQESARDQIPKFNASQRATCPCWGEWSDEHRDRVMSICGDLMRSYGYAEQLAN